MGGGAAKRANETPVRELGGQSAERKRVAAERFRRIWQLVEEIAREPGKSRKELAREYALSERQIQSDLNVIRLDMRLPLVRRQGYRFQIQDEPEPHGHFTLAEAQLLLVLLRRASHDPSLPGERLRALLGKLPHLFPPHLQPLVIKTLEAISRDPSGRQHESFTVVADALLTRNYVKLHYPAGDPISSISEPIVLPEVLFPYLDTWYLIGMCRQRAKMMVFDLETVAAVTPASGL